MPQLGANRIRLLLQGVDRPQDIFRMSRTELERIDGIGPTVAGEILRFNNWSQVDTAIESACKMGVQLITPEHEAYPHLLKEIYDPPALLWVKGDPQVLSMKGIAVVGTRKASKYGLRMAEHFASGLVENDVTIISGLALGVDGSAHQAALGAGGKTIGVLGSGIDIIYPRKHIRLAEEIVNRGGAVISEYPPGTKPDAGNFPVRNRIVSGLSLGTLVVESGIKGGSMITARLALDQNREVFVIPHLLGGTSGEGCNQIIKQGWGKLVQTTSDILMEIPLLEEMVSHREPAVTDSAWKSMELDDYGRSICELLEETPMHIDELSEQLGRPTHLLLSKLLELEMDNCIRQTAGKNFELV